MCVGVGVQKCGCKRDRETVKSKLPSSEESKKWNSEVELTLEKNFKLNNFRNFQVLSLSLFFPFLVTLLLSLSFFFFLYLLLINILRLLIQKTSIRQKLQLSYRFVHWRKMVGLVSATRWIMLLNWKASNRITVTCNREFSFKSILAYLLMYSNVLFWILKSPRNVIDTGWMLFYPAQAKHWSINGNENETSVLLCCIGAPFYSICKDLQLLWKTVKAFFLFRSRRK